MQVTKQHLILLPIPLYFLTLPCKNVCIYSILMLPYSICYTLVLIIYFIYVQSIEWSSRCCTTFPILLSNFISMRQKRPFRYSDNCGVSKSIFLKKIMDVRSFCRNKIQNWAIVLLSLQFLYKWVYQLWRERVWSLFDVQHIRQV